MFCKPILVVEDDEGIRSQVIEALTMEGHTVLEAADGQQALDILHALPDDELPGCIILDLMMPVLDGKAFIEEIDARHSERLGGIHVIVATAKGSPINPETLSRAVERIQKPFDLDQLYAAVARHCGR